MKRIKRALRAPLFWWLAVLSAGYIAAALATDAPSLLLVENSILAALSIGVAVAYAPAALQSLLAPKPRQEELLLLGIFLAWVASSMLRAMTAIRYGVDRPEVFGTDFSTLATFLSGLGAICHLAAPEAIDGWAPRRTWILAGAWISGGLILLVLLILFRTQVLVVL